MSLRKWKSYKADNISQLRTQLLNFTSDFKDFIFLDSCNNQVYGKPAFNYLLAAGRYAYIQCRAGNAFESLQKFIDEHNEWCFGHFGYDLKNETEDLHSDNPDHIGMPDLVFFVPEILVIQKADTLEIGVFDETNDEILKKISSTAKTISEKTSAGVILKPRIAKTEYLNKIARIKENITAGDLYEMNICQEFFAENKEISPLHIFDLLCKRSEAPFSVYYKWDDVYLISASPERFLKKDQNKIVSQPVKGTIRRGINIKDDEILKDKLFHSEKDRAENIMIVDLVRNDLTKSALTGTITVEELFGIYSFAQVHQMVSTVSAILKKNIPVTEIIRNTFPMGSMTGAPKIMAMELIEQYEETKRGLFSGSVGYFTPERDFDFNVVIRSILYNAASHYISAQVGGAIVYDSDPEEEFEECMLKLKALSDVLNYK